MLKKADSDDWSSLISDKRRLKFSYNVPVVKYVSANFHSKFIKIFRPLNMNEVFLGSTIGEMCLFSYLVL